jgi:MBG domain (YGX type)/YDG domain
VTNDTKQVFTFTTPITVAAGGTTHILVAATGSAGIENAQTFKLSVALGTDILMGNAAINNTTDFPLANTNDLTVVKPTVLSQVTGAALSASGVATWSNVSNESTFNVQLYKDAVALGDPASVAANTLTKDFLSNMRGAAGVYTVAVTAVGDGTIYSNGPASSASSAQTVIQLATVSAGLTWTGNVAHWTDVSNGQSYDVQLYKGGEIVADGLANAGVGATGADFATKIASAGPGSYTYTVKAKGNASLILDAVAASAASNANVYAAPLAKVTGAALSASGIATWADVSNESSYSVKLYNGADLVDTSTALSNAITKDLLSEMRAHGAGAYTVTVTAIGDGASYTDGPASDASSPVRTVIQPATVTAGLSWTGDVAHWTAVSGAVSYDVQLYKGAAPDELINVLAVNAAAGADFASDIASDGSGTYTYTVTAKGDEVLILNAAASAASNTNTTIAATAIAGITQPVAGATPDTTGDAGTGFTVTSVAWSPVETPFHPVEVYTATITIAPTAGYTLTGITHDQFTAITGATITSVANEVNSGVITAVFPATAVKQLTISAPAVTPSKEYTRTTDAAVTVGTLSGVASGDNVTVIAVANYDTVNIGTNKTITVVYTLGGDQVAKYVKPVDYLLYSGSITTKQLTIAAPDLGTKSKQYDGNNTAAVTAGSLSGVATGEEGSVTVTAVATYNNEDVATGKTITTVYTLDGVNKANYIKPINGTDATGAIVQRTLTITATGPTKIYGTALSAGAGATFTTSENEIAGESVTNVTLTPNAAGLSATTAAGAGYLVTPSAATGSGGFLAANYNITYTDYSGTVAQKALTITATGPAKIYGTALSAGAGATFTTNDAEVGSEAVTSVTLTPDATGASAATAAGAGYVVTPSLATGSDGFSAANYNITYAPSVGLTVGTKALTITAANKTKTYGAANPALTATYAGFVNDDDATDLTTQVTLATAADATTGVGTPAITAADAVGANYAITFVPGTLTIGQAALTITAANKTKTYGAANPALTATYAGFVNDDDATDLTTQVTLATAADATTGVGTPAITAADAVGANYAITFVPGTLTIGAKALTITATGPTKIYGTALSAGTSTINFTAGATGVGSEVVTSATLTPDAAGISATTTVGVGYVVTPSLATGTGGFLSANYNITYTGYDGIVRHGAVDHFNVTSSNYSPTTATAFTVTVTAVDAFDNVVDSADGATPFASRVFLNSDPTPSSLVGTSNAVASNGTLTLNIRLQTAETGVTIIAENNDATITGTSGSIAVSAGTGVGAFGIISTTNITNQTTGGAADDSYGNGWEWIVRMTLPTNQNDFALKFNNWASGSNALTAAGNMKYYSEQIASGTGSSAVTAVPFATAATYPTNLTVATDADATLDGIQTDIHIMVKIPDTTVAGSYSTSYKVNYE